MIEDKIKDNLNEEILGSNDDHLYDDSSLFITKAHKANSNPSEKDDNDKLKLQDILDREQDRKQRKEFSCKIFNIISWWLVFIAFIIFFQGAVREFNLSDSVMIALLTTTTANVLGLMFYVMHYLFFREKKD